MSTFVVKVRTPEGVREYEVPAESQEEARAYGKRSGAVLSVRKRSSFSEGAAISPADRQILFSRLGAMLKSRVGTSEALRLMRDNFKGGVGRICGKLLAIIEASGCDLAAAFEKVGAPDFPPTTIALIKAGARAGTTSEALKDAARFEWELAHVKSGSMKSVGGAIFAMVGALGTNLGSTHYLGPQISGSGLVSSASKLKDGIDTSWVHLSSDILSGIIGVVLLALLVLVTLAGVLKRIMPLAADKLIVRVPYYKDLVLSQQNYIALYGLAVLIRSGVSLESALGLSADAAPPGMLRTDFINARNAVVQGKRWAEAMVTLHPTDKAALAFSVDRSHVAETLNALAEQYRMQYKQRVETVGPMMQMVGAVFLVLAGGVMFAETIMPMLMASRNLL